LYNILKEVFSVSKFKKKTINIYHPIENDAIFFSKKSILMLIKLNTTSSLKHKEYLIQTIKIIIGCPVI